MFRHLHPGRWLAGVMLVAISMITGACSGSGGVPDGTTISVSGAFALYPLMTIWAQEYQAIHPEVRFDVQAGGAGKGMSDVLSGVVDVAMLSREVRPEELENGAFVMPVTIDAVVATVNASNPVLDRLMQIGITPESGASLWLTGEITTWGELVGSSDTSPINVYTRSDSCGAAEVWAKFLGGMAQEELLGTGVNGDPGLAEAVRQDPLAIGYNNVGFAYDLETGRQVEGIRVVPLDLNVDGQITPDEDFYDVHADLTQAIANHIYPYPPARVLYLVTKGTPAPAVAEFYRWVLTDGQQYVNQAGYVPLTAGQIQEALALLEQ